MLPPQARQPKLFAFRPSYVFFTRLQRFVRIEFGDRLIFHANRKESKQKKTLLKGLAEAVPHIKNADNRRSRRRKELVVE